MSARLAECLLIDRLLADHLGDFLVGGIRLAAKEEGGIDNRFCLFIVAAFQLCDRLEDD